MWWICLKLSLRAMGREKFPLLVNLFSLSTGIAAFLVAALYLIQEIGYDRHFDRHQNIYRIVTERRIDSTVEQTAMGSAQIASSLASEYPDVRSYLSFAQWPGLELYTSETDKRDWERLYHTDPHVFDFFSHQILYGNPATALTEPNAIALSRSMANHYFDLSNPIGRTLSEEGRDYVVTLVFEDLPPNTHLRYDALLSWAPEHLRFLNLEGRQRQFFMFLAQTNFNYLEMTDSFEPESFESLAAEFVARNFSELIQDLGLDMTLSLEPLASIHFDSSAARDLPRGDRSSVLILVGLSFSLLFVALLNYVNLALARLRKRHRQLALRKLLGEHDAVRLGQEFLESSGYLLGASLIAAGIVFLARHFSPWPLPPLSVVSEFLNIYVLILAAPLIWLLLSLLLSIAVVSRLRFLSPMSALSMLGNAQMSWFSMGKIAAFLQLTAAVLILSFTFSLWAQLQHLNDRPLGYDPSDKLIVEVRGADSVRRLPTLITELTAHGNVLGATVTVDLASNTPRISTPGVETEDGSFRTMSINHIIGDSQFLEVMGIGLLRGRNLSSRDRDELGRTNLVNETLVRRMGWTQPLDKRVGTWQVTGVVEDFNFNSLHNAIEPMVIRLDDENLERAEGLTAPRMRRVLLLHIAPQNQSDTLDYIARSWSEFQPDRPFEYDFLESSLAAFYRNDRDRIVLLGLMATLCVAIAAIGTAVLLAQDAARRRRDITIRRVLGASAAQVLWLLVQNLSVVVLSAVVSGSVLAYLLLNDWLRSFPYRAAIDVGLFLLSATLILSLLLAIASWQTHRTGAIDLSQSLRRS